MNKIDSISVIVPTFNRMDYLEETLKAILAQEVQDLEIIVVDDCSTDNTKEFLTNISKAFQQIVPVFLSSNQGESCAVNAGWKIAQKRFVAIVNSDDPPHNDWLRDMSEGINTNPGYGFYYPNRLVIDKYGQPIRYEILENWSNRTLFEILIPIASAGLVIDKRHLPIDFMPRDPKVVFPSDLLQMFNLGLITSGIKIDGAWGVWREHDSSFSSATNVIAKASLFENSVRDWLTNNSHSIKDGGSASIREAYLYGHMWRIYRTRNGFSRSIFLLAKSSLLSSIRKRPRLILSIILIAIRYAFNKSV